jgi:hypothetical protein
VLLVRGANDELADEGRHDDQLEAIARRGACSRAWRWSSRSRRRGFGRVVESLFSQAQECSSVPDVPRVFISYSHDSPGHSQAVREFADCLRRHGHDAWIDQYAQDPDQGWPRWMAQQIEQAEFVLIVPTAPYLRRWNGQEAPGAGLGATWEGLLLTNQLYLNHGSAKGMRCVLVGDARVEHIPNVLQGHTYFAADAGTGCSKLDRYLRKLPPTAEPPPLAPLTPIVSQWSTPSPDRWKRRKLLSDFLVEAFSPVDLDGVLALIPGGDALRHSLPPATTTARGQYSTAFIDVLIQTKAISHDPIWEGLVEVRPLRNSEILILRSMWK